MWRETLLLLLLHGLEAVPPCQQGATFPEAVASPAVDGSGIRRVPGAASLPQCVAAACGLPGSDLAWLFQGRCYVLSCRRRGDCRPRDRPGADSVLAFLRRTAPPGPPDPPEPGDEDLEAREDLEALQDLALFEGPQLGLAGAPGTLDLDLDPEGREDRGNRFNRSEPGPERDPTRGVQTRPSDGATGGPPDPVATETTTETASSSDPPAPTGTSGAAGTLGPPLTTPPGNPVEQRPPTVSPDQPADALQSGSVRPGPPARTDDPRPLTRTATAGPPPPVPSDPPRSSLAACIVPSTSMPPAAAADVGGSNRGPLAIVGPDRKLFLPLSSLWLNGSGSTDDRGVSSYRWEVVSGPPGARLEAADQAVATVTGVRAGRYTFRLTVRDQEGVEDSASLSVRVEEARTPPPVAHASGSHTLVLPNDSLVLRGSVTDGDQSQVRYQWTRDGQSPAAGVVLYGSETLPSLYLSGLVQGTYLFQLRVTDARGRSSVATATVEVQPESSGVQQVELEMLVQISQVSVSQRDTLVRQLAALMHVLDRDVQVRALQGRSHLSTVLRFSVGGPGGPLSGSRVVSLLRNQLLGEKTDYLLFRVLRVDTVVCLLHCSGRGQCDPITKQCVCDPFWTENLVRRYLGDGDSNCEWRVLYVIVSSFVLVVFILSAGWTFVCCCRRSRDPRLRRKTKYSILDNMDEELELRPRFSIKHRSTEHNSSLMMSESELDSDQDSVFSRDRPGPGPGRLKNRGGGPARNGNAFG
ncbi:dyslexia-associated protein KIAA0319-like [Cololabis saira]|uniref:dyslexia-associated protein KIAA0319-like n=1 Tax=Cololabis saira TaxID=129043 RepID=UPI002AD330CD|nr:dyslexia-associated protein KIAA0319-like [Cololabis saira]